MCVWCQQGWGRWRQTAHERLYENTLAHITYSMYEMYKSRVTFVLSARCFTLLSSCLCLFTASLGKIKTNRVFANKQKSLFPPWKRILSMNKAAKIIKSLSKSRRRKKGKETHPVIGFARKKMQRVLHMFSTHTRCLFSLKHKPVKLLFGLTRKLRKQQRADPRGLLGDTKERERTCSEDDKKKRENSTCRDFSEVSLSELEENDSNFVTQSCCLSFFFFPFPPDVSYLFPMA